MSSSMSVSPGGPSGVVFPIVSRTWACGCDGVGCEASENFIAASYRRRRATPRDGSATGLQGDMASAYASATTMPPSVAANVQYN